MTTLLCLMITSLHSGHSARYGKRFPMAPIMSDRYNRVNTLLIRSITLSDRY